MHKAEGRGKRGGGGGGGGDVKRKRGRKNEVEVKETGKKAVENKKKNDRGSDVKSPRPVVKKTTTTSKKPETQTNQSPKELKVVVGDSETSLSDAPWSATPASSSDTRREGSKPSSVTGSDEGRQSVTSEDLTSTANPTVETEVKKQIEPAALVASVKNELSEYYRLHDECLKQFTVLTERSKMVYRRSEKNEQQPERLCETATVHPLTDDLKLSSKAEQDSIDYHAEMTHKGPFPDKDKLTFINIPEIKLANVCSEKIPSVDNKKAIDTQMDNNTVSYNLTGIHQNIYTNQIKASSPGTENYKTTIYEINNADYSAHNNIKETNDVIEFFTDSSSKNIEIDDDTAVSDYKERNPGLKNLENINKATINCKINEDEDNDLSNTDYENISNLSWEENRDSALSSYEIATEKLNKEYEKLCAAAALLGGTRGNKADVSKKRFSEFNNNNTDDAGIVECIKTKLVDKVLEESFEKYKKSKTLDGEIVDYSKKSTQEYGKKSSDRSKNKERRHALKVMRLPIESDFGSIGTLEPFKVEIFKKPKLVEATTVVAVQEKSSKPKSDKKFSLPFQGRCTVSSLNGEITFPDLDRNNYWKRTSEQKQRKTENKVVPLYHRSTVKAGGGDSIGTPVDVGKLKNEDQFIAQTLRAQIEKVSMEEYFFEKRSPVREATVKVCPPAISSEETSLFSSEISQVSEETLQVSSEETPEVEIVEEKSPPAEEPKGWSLRRLVPSKDMILDAIFSVLTGFVLYYLIDLNVRHFFLGESDDKDV